jgi:methionine-rich copper-binding protein CopC
MRRSTHPSRFSIRLPAMAAMFLAAMSLGAAPSFHFGLAKSAPAEGDTAAAVSQVELWFTQVPQDGSLSVRVVTAGGDLVPAGDPEQDPEDGKHFTVNLDDTLPPGAYTVAWRGMGDDGHVVRGEFGFAVTES